MKKILVVSGVSGVGKNTIIEKIIEWCKDFVFVPQYTTRRLREGERVRRKLSEAEMDLVEAFKTHIVIRASNGRRYAVEFQEIYQIINNGRVPILDWPISRHYQLAESLPGAFLFVYLLPPSMEELKRRMSLDGRDLLGKRIQSGIEEIYQIHQGDFDHLIDTIVVSEKDKMEICAKKIIEFYSHLAS